MTPRTKAILYGIAFVAVSLLAGLSPLLNESVKTWQWPNRFLLTYTLCNVGVNICNTLMAYLNQSVGRVDGGGK
jgi:hypothetical protein